MTGPDDYRSARGETDEQCALRILAILFGATDDRAVDGATVRVIAKALRDHRSPHVKDP